MHWPRAHNEDLHADSLRSSILTMFGEDQRASILAAPCNPESSVKFGNIVTGVETPVLTRRWTHFSLPDCLASTGIYTPVLAKHSKHFSLEGDS